MSFNKDYVDIRLFRYDKLDHVELIENLEYQHKENFKFIIPKGFKTDLASIPRLFWSIVAPIGKHSLAAILHDFLYSEGFKLGISRKEADQIFYEAMLKSHVAKITAFILWFFVRIFGKRFYKKA